jgi:hypothetical protein
VVSGDAAEGGSDVGVAVLTVDADGEVAQAAMTTGPPQDVGTADQALAVPTASGNQST